jgi:phosphatidylserine decarboxylase
VQIPLTKYGLREIVIATIVCGLLAAVAAWLFWPVTVLPAALWVYVLCFFRDPQRKPAEENAFICPADGVVADITPVGPESPLGTEGVRIGIFMSIFNVHVNRSPCVGTVTKLEHDDGGYADARKPEAAELNESATIHLSVTDENSQAFSVVVRQVAGFIARRIITDLRVGQELQAAERIVAVQVGQTVQAGRSVLVRLPAQEKQE